MKKVFFTLILLFIISSTICYATPEGFDTIKLGLFFGSGAKDKVNLSSDNGFDVGYESDGEFVPTLSIENSYMTVFVNADGKMEIEGVSVIDGDMMIVPKEGYITIEETTYRGGCILLLKDSKMTVINKVDTEEYLYSVLGKEMSPSWPLEALKAQAICARSYAHRNKNKFAAYGFNLCTTTVSQVYGGVATESERTIQAVNETRGQLLKYNGQVAETLFYASDGGYTADPKYVWGSSVPYLTAKEDNYEVNENASYGTWSVTYTAEDIENMLAKREKSIGKVKNIVINGVDNGTVYDVDIIGGNGTYNVKNDNVRGFFGLKSQLFTIDAQLADSENGSIIDDWSLFTQNVKEFYKNEDMSIFAKEKKATSFTFNGKGYGHRVGMSQCGARDMALMGFTASKILDFYYTGTYIE